MEECHNWVMVLSHLAQCCLCRPLTHLKDISVEKAGLCREAVKSPEFQVRIFPNPNKENWGLLQANLAFCF